MAWRQRLLGLALLMTCCYYGEAQDNRPPTFAHALFPVTLVELPAENQTYVIYRASATDPDGDNVTYSIPANTHNSDLFTVDGESGEVFTLSGVVLDRETLAPSNEILSLFIEARDGFEHDSYNQLQLNIFLLDRNDNPPRFTPDFPTTFTIAEDTPTGSTLLTVDATDADSGSNADIFFSLMEHTSLFSLDYQTGELTLAMSLDYDDPDTREHPLIIVAEDGGSPALIDLETLTVMVSDVDDLDPVFEPSSYSTSIHENTTRGEVVETVRAMDGDTGINEDVYYTLEDSGNSLINGQRSFIIDSETGEIAVNVSSLDRETHTSYTLTVKAFQVNDSSKDAMATVHITVLDNNDNIPMFEFAEYNSTVSEDEEEGHSILTVTASDRDVGDNAEFAYILEDVRNSSSTLPFVISSDGVITLSREVDFEETDNYLFRVMAQEEGGGNGSTLVRVYVENRNDERPVFDPVKYSRNISEGVAPGAFIEQVTATDGDRGIFGKITYSLSSGHFGNFSINDTASGGSVYTEDELDYEERSEYTIIIQASDTPEEGMESRVAPMPAELIVEVININDNPPVFDREVLTVQLDEEAEEGTTVATLAVTDADGEGFTERSFSITAGNDMGNFTFDPDSENVVVTAMKLDYDLNPDLREQTLTIVVNDTTFTNEITLIIQLQDINDNTPSFENASYQFPVYEEVDTGSQVGTVVAVDNDSGDLGRVAYSISDNDKFAINSTTGVLTTKAGVDREQTSVYTVTVTATDQDPEEDTRRSNSVQVSITVLDVNDNSPQFSMAEYELEIEENTDTVEFSITATDRDTGSNSQILYELTDGNTNSAFVIGRVSGVLRRNASVILDREQEQSYLITVMATDRGDPPNNSTATVAITIEDENDESPVFSPDSLNTTINEAVGPNTFVLQVTATDRDTPPNAMLQYTISVAGPPQSADPAPPSGSFTIDETLGEIRTSGTFDRESFEGPYVLTVVVADNGEGGSLSATAEITVFLSDVNDNDPVFQPSEYTATLDEELPPNQSVAMVMATDIDLGSNQELSYSISSVVALDNIEDQSAVASHFAVNSTSGVVVTGARLDYEFVQRYRVSVTATDRGVSPRSSSATVTVTVLDVNDHTPQFSQDSYLLTLSEATLRNTRFTLIEVTDLDTGENSRLTFTADITSPFQVDSENGQVIVADTLDYETNTSYSFTVNVTDNAGSDARMNSTEVRVQLLDVNDNPPVFENDSYSVIVPERDYSSTSDVILTVLATDQDSGNFSRVSYTMIPAGHALFSLNTVTGEVSVVADVDFESLNAPVDATAIDMQLIIQASDGGNPSMTSSVTVTVTITDENDNAPMFEGLPYNTMLRENTAPGVEVIAVRATDRDGNRNGVVRYSLNHTKFSIDDVTGVITTGTSNTSSGAVLYDYDSGEREYMLTVFATDNGTTEQQSMSATVTVGIVDVNDNAPEIVAVTPSALSLREDASSQRLPVNIVVTDEDSGENGQVEYQLSNDGGLFHVNSTGVYLVFRLDREAVAEYNITITVTDRGQPRRRAESYLIVTVSDVNDNPPVFEQDSYTKVLSEDAEDGHSVITVYVVDRDSRSGGGGQLVFRILGDDTGAFTHEATARDDGLWSVTVRTVGESFDYESGRRLYDLKLEARDGVTPVMVVTANLTVTIVDVNDESPVFSPSSYVLSLPENLPEGGAVGSVLATDRDGANNGLVSYGFSEDTPASITATFSLDPATGVLELQRPIDFESGVRSYQFNVVAMDAGSPPMSSTAAVIVNIQDINEVAPMFSQDLYTATVIENIGPQVVLTVMANDSEVQNAITYGIVTGSTADFDLGSTSGILSTLVSLDREAIPQYIFTLQAVDGEGIAGRTSYTQVAITVGDLNDEDPTFPLEFYTYHLPENTPPSTTPILTPSQTATDADLGSNSELVYSLAPPTSPSQPFRVVPSTGEVVLTASLDRETRDYYSLTLTATDQGTPSRPGSIELRVIVTDVDDRFPTFDMTSYSATVPENSPDGVSVVTVAASDPDTIDILTYAISDGDPDRQFEIDQVSGLISTTAVSLDREMEDEHILRVTVTDIGLRTDEVDVVVTVEDQNDNTPLFTSSSYSSSHLEANSDNLEVAVVTANDRDEGSNGQVQYSITGGNSNDVFYIDSSSGQIVARAGRLDYETDRIHTLTVEATDLAQPMTQRRFSTAVVTVELVDVNDNRPMFSQSEYRTSLLENAPVGTTVARISATDGDSGTNGEIVYSFGTTSSSLFSINSTTGVVIVTGSVNYEMGSEYELSVEARDHGNNPQRSQVVALHIQIINAEDESPRFPTSFFTTTVTEDVSSESSVLVVTATDPDGSDSLVYDIIMTSSSAGSDHFRIDPQSGLISTAGTLDRESVAVVNLLVIATDSAGLNGTALVQITVGDVNDNAPRFLAESYSASLRENSVVGTTIIPFSGGNSTRVEARDVDGPGVNSEVSYDKAGKDRDKFSVDKDTGIVTVAPGAVLDREEGDVLELVITAEDHGEPERTASVTMTITLLDENDNPPTFVPRSGYAVVVPEDESLGSVLVRAMATDPDLMAGGEVSFREITASPLAKLSCFSVNSTTGVITLVDSLDREEDPVIDLLISAHDNGEPRLVASTTVRVIVTDVNDNPPTFSQNTYITTVSEQHTVGASVLTVLARDPDSGTNGQVEYAVADSNTPFTINSNTGELSTQSTLDYETQRQHDITVQACDKGPGQNCSTAVVRVYVTDFNDNFPTFDFATYRTDVCHSQSAGVVVIRPVAVDRDSGTNALLTYSLDDESVLVVMPATGGVYLKRNVSEEEGSEFTAVITARDGSSPAHSDTATVLVRVLNCTSDTIRFQVPIFKVSTSELVVSSSLILRPSNADNINTVPPSTVTFDPSLSPNPFELQSNLLTVADHTLLDRETRGFYTLPVTAASGEGERVYATISVTVEDGNDNRPELRVSDLTFIVPENTSAPVDVTIVTATDDDIGENAAIQFRFAVSNDYFDINPITGVVTTVTELDREKIQEHQLTIEASDGDLVSEPVTITVAVSDRNDNAPHFTRDSYSEQVVENMPAGTSVLTVEATDDDIGENAAISFLIVDGDINIFSLNSETGVLRTTTALDYETETQYSLVVMATDNGAPILNSTVHINITVLDFNDHTPMFLNPLTFTSILEGVAIGTVLTDFNVTDSDSGDLGVRGVRYSIVAGNTDQFSVNAVSGILKTEARLDRDTGTVCQFLSIQARDSAGDNSLANVTEIEVCLIDENDNCPNFTQPSFSGRIPENENINEQLIIQVQATDADSDTSTNGRVEYRLLVDGGVFDINPTTGYLLLTATLDTEAVPSYELVVEACDGGTEPCCTNTTITVEVLDVNDNKPVIQNINPGECIDVLETNDSYSCAGSVPEVGNVVFTVNATDRDSGASGTVFFELVGQSSAFSITPGGVVTISNDLDYEQQQTYQVYISAIDHGVPLSLTSDIRILCINVLDINDRAPSFPVEDAPQFSITQDEGVIPDSAIVHVVATDEDSGDNAVVTYAIASGNTSIFRINEETGLLYLEQELDCETATNYTLTVTANNSLSSCPLIATATVLISVNDVNDNRPVFSQAEYNTTVNENVPLPFSLLQLRASDDDKDAPNNDLLYTLDDIITGTGNPFQLQGTTGELTIENPLDAETLQPDLNYTLRVMVEDKGLPVMRDFATVVVFVRDVNDQPPVFSDNTYSVAVSEGEGPSLSLTTLLFSDNDVVPSNRDSIVSIAMVTGNRPNGTSKDLSPGSELFSVDGNTSLQLQHIPDREAFSSYDIIMSVDNTAPCYLPSPGDCSGSAVVTVAVTDVNDNQPQFTSLPYSGEVSVTASTGTSVLTVHATDADSGPYGEVRYSIADTVSGRFRVDEESGVILTRGNFGTLDGQRLTLKVMAYDNPGSSPSLTSTATVSIIVLNDFQRISVQFSCGIDTIVQSEDTIINIIANVSGLDIQVENYADHSDDIASNFIFHATDPVTNEIVDFDEFFKRLEEGGQGKEDELIAQLSTICPVEKITAFADIDAYQYPDALDTQTIVIFILCVILVVGAFTSLVLAIRQRWVALHDTRSKLLADVFYGSPGSTSLVENVQHENYQLEEMDMRGGGGNRQNPMFVQPYDNWQGVDASGPESTGDVSSMNRDNPLYESQEIRMEMFADVSDEEEGDEADDAELLAAALKEDEEPEDNSVTAI